MEIRIMYFGGCPNADAAHALALEAAAGQPHITVVTQQVDSPEDAERGRDGRATVPRRRLVNRAIVVSTS